MSSGERELPKLSPRRQEVLDLMLNGLNSRQIADQLVITPGTVSNHIGRIFQILGVHSRLEARQEARRSGLVETPDSFPINSIHLAPRLSRVLELLALGLTSEEIAGRLNIGPGTVDNYVADILDVFQVRSRRQAVHIAENQGLI